jgi:hypothetical protein
MRFVSLILFAAQSATLTAASFSWSSSKIQLTPNGSFGMAGQRKGVPPGTYRFTLRQTGPKIQNLQLAVNTAGECR